MFMFETLKLVPGGEILGISYEAFPIMLFGLAGVLMLLVPFLEVRLTGSDRSRAFTVLGFVAIVYIVAMTAWGYRSLVPLYVVLLTGVLIALLGLGTRRREGSKERKE
jgi:quinol-cytochrome oxidoreductase complex cytochrome b subunit